MLPDLVTLFTNLLQTKKGVGEKVQTMLLSLQPIRKSPALGAIRDLYNHSFNNVTLVFPSKVSQTPYFHILYYVSTCIFLHICVVVPELTCVLVCLFAAYRIYQNPALLRVASAAFWTSCRVISKLF